MARGPDLPALAARLVRMGICRSQASGVASLNALWQDLYLPTRPLNNIYLHLTWRCQLWCDHCYARADPQGRGQADLPVAELAAPAGDVLTGGEPLMHRERTALLEAPTQARG